jgi:hypothetical protein
MTPHTAIYVSSYYYRPDALSAYYYRPDALSAYYYRPDALSSYYCRPDALAAAAAAAGIKTTSSREVCLLNRASIQP